MTKYFLMITSSILLLIMCGCNLEQTTSSTSIQKSETLVSPTTQIISANTNQSKSDKGSFNSKSGYKPKNGFVPDEETAIAIAVAVWNPIYGKEIIQNEKPYKARLENGNWIVTGSLPEGADGGTATAIISQDNGCILKVIHYQ